METYRTAEFIGMERSAPIKLKQLGITEDYEMKVIIWCVRQYYETLNPK